MGKNIFYVCTLILLLVACGGNNDDTFTSNPTDTSNNDNSNNNNNGGNTSQNWLIPFSEVKDGGPGKDGIPSIDNPIFVEANDPETDYLTDDDLVIGVVENGIIRAYPHKILDWHLKPPVQPIGFH